MQCVNCTSSVYICSMYINIVHAARILFYNVYLHVGMYTQSIKNIICSLQMYACPMFTHNLRCYVHLNNYVALTYHVQWYVHTLILDANSANDCKIVFNFGLLFQELTTCTIHSFSGSYGK